MGGHAAGEVASQLVIAALAHLDDDEPGGDLLSQLNDAVHRGQRRDRRARRGRPRTRGHGHHAHRNPVRGQQTWPRPHRRLARLPAPRRRAHPDHQGRHVRPDAGRRGPHHRRGGAQPPAAVADHARADRARGRADADRCARPASATATCCAPTGCPMRSATRPSSTRCRSPTSPKVPTGSSNWRCAAAARTTSPCVVADVVDFGFGQTQPILAGAVSGDDDQTAPPEHRGGPRVGVQSDARTQPPPSGPPTEPGAAAAQAAVAAQDAVSPRSCSCCWWSPGLPSAG